MLFDNRILIAADRRREALTFKLGDKKLWNIDDVAMFTGFSKGTIYNLTSQDQIPYRKKRGRLFFIPSEIQNWIDEGD